MAGFFNKKKHRTVIPRWRLFGVTTWLGELSDVRDRVRARGDAADLSDLLRDFADNKTIWHASDLLSTAFVLGQSDLAKEAAHFVVEHAKDAAAPAVELATRVVYGFRPDVPDTPEWEDAVRADRRHLSEYNWDPPRWADLGLAHTVLGNRNRAIRSLITATQLAPCNRFIARAAVRCFMHWGEPDRAQSVLRVALAGTSDPWLLAADLATTLARERRPKNVSAAKLVAEDRSIHAHHVSELATAIASLELDSGSARKAKAFFKLAMTDPTENSVAQVEWMLAERNISAPSIENIDHVPLLYEAKARDRYSDGDWEQALHYALKWFDDQPFSSRPADMASYSAGLLQRYDQAAKYLECAMRSNPCEVMMINNLAYFQAMDDRVGAAVQTFAELEGLAQTEDERLVIQATRGLLSMRTGDTEVGRALYRATIDQAWARKKMEVRIIAMLNFAREEYRLGNAAEAFKLLEIARAESRRVDDKEILTTLRTTEAALEKMPEMVS